MNQFDAFLWDMDLLGEWTPVYICEQCGCDMFADTRFCDTHQWCTRCAIAVISAQSTAFCNGCLGDLAKQGLQGDSTRLQAVIKRYREWGDDLE